MNLLERIEWLVANRAEGNQRELDRRAGMPQGHVGVLINRLRKDPDRAVEHPTLVKLAKATGVSLDWLIMGEGDIDRTVSQDSLPVFRNLPGWADWEARVLEQFKFTPAEVSRARGMRAQVSPKTPATFEVVLDALQLARAMPPEEIIAAANAAADKRIDKIRKTADTKLKKQREAGGGVPGANDALHVRDRKGK